MPKLDLLRRPAQKITQDHSPMTGQSLVEFALLVPILMLIMVGVVDLGRVYYAYLTVVNSAREGARYGATHPNAGTTAIQNQAKREAQGSGIDPSSLTVRSVNYPEGCNWGSPIQVTVGYPFRMITSYIFGGTTIQLQSTAEMPILDVCP